MPGDIQTILPAQSSPWLRINEQVSGARWADLDVDVIRRFKDAWTCPAHLLNFRAFELSVDIWDENWTDLKKRSVIASAPKDHRLKGTEAGLRRYLAIAGAELIGLVTPPQGIFAGRTLTVEERAAHIARHPKVRIVMASQTGSVRPREGTFAGRTFAGADFIRVDDGLALRGRKAFLVRPGQAPMPLRLSRVVTAMSSRAGSVVERVVMPGRTKRAAIANVSFAGHEFCEGSIAPRYYSFDLVRAFDHVESRVALDTVGVGFRPRTVVPVRESEIGEAGRAIFAGDHAGRNFAAPDRGGDLLADVIYLHDPAIAAPAVQARSFAGVSRVGMPAHTAEIQIDAHAPVPKRTTFAGTSYASRSFARPHDPSRRNLVINAVASSKRKSDKVLATLQVRRPRTLADGIRPGETIRLGDTVPYTL